MRHLFYLLLFTLLYNCNSPKTSNVSLEQLIPKNSSLILKINDFDSFKTDINNNNLVNAVFQNELDSIIAIIEAGNLKSKLFICFDKAINSPDFSIIGTLNDSISKLDSSLYHNIIDDYFIASTSKTIIEKFELNQNADLNKFNVNNNSFSILIKDDNTLNTLGGSLLDNEVDLFSENMQVDLELFPDNIQFTGISLTNDSITTILDVFNKTSPQENSISQIAPISSTSFTSITFSDFLALHKNLNQYKNIKADLVSTVPLFETVNEIGTINLNKENAVVLKSLDAETTKDALLEFQEELTTYRNIPIYKFGESTIFNETLSPFIKSYRVSKYIIFDNFFVFSDSESMLQEIISNYQNKTVLSNSETFKSIKASLSDASSLLIYFNSEKLNHITTSLFKNPIESSVFKDYTVNAFQFTIDDNFIHINGVIKKEKQKSSANGIIEEFNIKIADDILTGPYFVINHNTNEKEIVVQDINNNLYLISNKGKVLWKKRLDTNIIGHIQQVDLYKNGRLQLAFATANKIYVIDRKGNDVSPFPLHFNDKITQPLSIFDYDRLKNYRFLVTQGSNLLMYDKNGKRINGFKYNPSGDIITQPKHFRISGKDYIVFAAGNTMKILSRQGKDRITVNESIHFSGNPIYKYQDKFTTTSNSGDLIQVNLKGNVSAQILNLQSNHTIEATNKTFITLSDNILTIKQKSIELDFGDYTTPKLFYLNDKIYITITDLQTQKIYLYDSQGRLIANFPVYGNSAIDLDNIDKDSNLEFVVKGDEDSVILYQKN